MIFMIMILMEMKGNGLPAWMWIAEAAMIFAMLYFQTIEETEENEDE